MHAMVVFTRRSRQEAVLGAWLSNAVRCGEKVLVLRATYEDASLLDRSLATAGLDPSGLAGSGQAEVLDTLCVPRTVTRSSTSAFAARRPTRPTSQSPSIPGTACSRLWSSDSRT
jgi:hypothetical protein